MKNLLLLLALTLANPLFSQEKKDVPPPEAARPKFSLSIIGGLNSNNMPLRPNHAIEGSSYNDRMQAEHAYFVGLSGRQPICKHFAAKLDAQYVVKGFGVKMTSPGSQPPVRYQFSYLELVPQLEYNVYKNIFFSLGGYGALRLKEHIKYGDKDWEKIDVDFIQWTENFDWGVASGLRLEFGRFSALVQYHFGLTPAIKLEVSNDTGQSTPANQYHRSLQLGLGFKII